jgi:mannosyltransferase
MRRPSNRTLAVLGIAGIAAFVFLFQIGASSFFIDEELTMKSADGPLARLWHAVRLDENNPPPYFLLLHGWLRLVGSNAEWAARLPSALACVALVVVVFRIGTLADRPSTGYVAALLAAVSPLLLLYAQQARVYALATLACAVATMAVLEAERSGSWRWVAAGAVASALALSLHYFTLLVIAPLCAWAVLRRRLERRMLIVLCAIPGAVWLAWLPFALIQARDGRQAELGEYGTLTKGHAVRVLAAPFDDRYTTEVGPLKVAAAAVVAIALFWAIVRLGRPDRSAVGLLVALVVISAVALALAALAGKELFHSRYMTFAAPYILVVVAAALVRAPRPVAAVGVGVLVAAAVAGIVGSNRRTGFYPDARGAVEAIRAQRRPGDVVVHAASLGTWYSVDYYAARLLRGTPVLSLFDGRTARVLAQRRRVWLVRDERTGGANAPPPPGYRRALARRFVGAEDVTLLLELPRPK